jgi:alkanesulfonate monooxygenase SsuD/methylene tetrahydromethanopterin reductase-like flavin-dependent oxidoreductase (luciferase family)
MSDRARVSFGIKTTPVHTTYEEILRIWQEADEVPEIEHAWLWDHFLPLSGPKDGPIYEGWTLLGALAAQTARLRLGLLVTSNRVREPAVLGKIASTVDAISHGRLIMGIGVGGTHQPDGSGGVAGPNPALAEYEAYGLTLVPPAEGIARLAETIAILERMWAEPVFDFEGRYYQLRGTRNEPRPARRPPLLVGGWGNRTLRLVAEHADIWNIPGPPHSSLDYIAERSRVLDGHCAALGRDPGQITRSVQLVIGSDDPAGVRKTILELVGLGVTHIVLGVRQPHPRPVAHWLAEEIIAPVRAEL